MPGLPPTPEGAPKAAPTSTDDLHTLAALGDEKAIKALEELSKAQPTPPAVDPVQQQHYNVATLTAAQAEELAKAQASGANPPAPPAVPNTATQEQVDGGQKTPGDPVLSKADEKQDDETDEEYKERMEKKCKVTKSLDPDEEALNKAMDIVEAVARGATSEPDPDRREILAKGYSDGTLTEIEQKEFLELVKSTTPQDDPDSDPEAEALNKGFKDALLSDPALQAGVQDDEGNDVGPWMERISAFVGGSLDTISEDLTKALGDNFSRLHAFNYNMVKANRAMARMVVGQSQLIKSLTGRLQVVEETPLPRATVPTARALAKSQTPGVEDPNAGIGLGRDELVKGFNTLTRETKDGLAPCGRNLTNDVAHYESHGQVHPEMLADIKKALGK